MGPHQSDPDNPYTKELSQTEDNSTPETRSEKEQMISVFYSAKVTAAKAIVDNGGLYTPVKYFTDMRDINSYCKKNGIGRKPILESLLGLMQMSLDRDHSLYETLDSARDIAIPGSFAWDKKYKDQPINWRPITQWSVGLYLHMLPWVFILFLLWLYEENNLKKFQMRNPLNFILLVVLHPIILFWAVSAWWINTGRETLGKIEIRRTKKRLFSLFSQDELALIEQFTKSTMSLKEFRKLHGRTLRHSFSITVVCSLLIICMPCLAKNYCTTSTIRTATYLTNSRVQASIRGSTSYLKHDTKESPPSTQALTLIRISMNRGFKRLYYTCTTSYLLSKGHRRTLDHVPLLLTSLYKIS
jgi:hypothetical protein